MNAIGLFAGLLVDDRKHAMIQPARRNSVLSFMHCARLAFVAIVLVATDSIAANHYFIGDDMESYDSTDKGAAVFMSRAVSVFNSIPFLSKSDGDRYYGHVTVWLSSCYGEYYLHDAYDQFQFPSHSLVYSDWVLADIICGPGCNPP